MQPRRRRARLVGRLDRENENDEEVECAKADAVRRDGGAGVRDDYFPKIPVPVTGGYVHLGDGAIFLSVLLLGPLGIPAAAVGSMLSDLIGGYMVYVLPTFLIKGLVALVAWKLCWKDQPLLALLSFLLAEAVMVLGYFLLEWALYGIASAAAAIGPNVVQGIAGVLIGMLCLLITPRLERVAKL